MELCGVVVLTETILLLLAKVFSRKEGMFVFEILMLSLFWIAAGHVVLRKQINIYQNNVNQDLAARNSLWNYIAEEQKEVVFISNIRYNTRGSIQLYMQDQPLMCIKSPDELEKLPDILIFDNDDNNTLSDDLFEAYEFTCFLGLRSVYALSGLDINESKEQTIPLDLFAHQDLQMEESGHVLYGPYITLNPGIYEVTFSMDSADTENRNGGIFDVASAGNTLAFYDWNGETQQVTLRFQLEERTSNMEFRYYKNAGNDSMPEEITLRMIQ